MLWRYKKIVFGWELVITAREITRILLQQPFIRFNTTFSCFWALLIKAFFFFFFFKSFQFLFCDYLSSITGKFRLYLIAFITIYAFLWTPAIPIPSHHLMIMNKIIWSSNYYRYKIMFNQGLGKMGSKYFIPLYHCVVDINNFFWFIVLSTIGRR